jgi:hypothetical protein
MHSTYLYNSKQDLEEGRKTCSHLQLNLGYSDTLDTNGVSIKREGVREGGKEQTDKKRQTQKEKERGGGGKEREGEKRG